MQIIGPGAARYSSRIAALVEVAALPTDRRANEAGPTPLKVCQSHACASRVRCLFPTGAAWTPHTMHPVGPCSQSGFALGAPGRAATAPHRYRSGLVAPRLPAA